MIVAYLRVSTDEQVESGLGLDAQLESIEKAIGTPDKVFRDEGYSGSKANRPALLEALESLKEGDILAVAKGIDWRETPFWRCGLRRKRRNGKLLL